MTNGILIADDSGIFRTAVRTYLTQQNFEVCGEAIDGTDVLEKATQLEPALIILDLRMPNMTMYDEVMGYKSLMSAIGVDATIPKMNCFDSLAECVRGLLSSPTPRSPRNEQNHHHQETGSGMA